MVLRSILKKNFDFFRDKKNLSSSLSKKYCANHGQNTDQVRKNGVRNCTVKEVGRLKKANRGSVASVFGFLMLIGTIYDLMRVHKVFELRKSTIQAQEEPTAYFEDPSSDSHELDEDEAGLIRSVAFSTTEPTPLKIWEKLIIAFSIYTNALKILDTKQQDGRLNCLDGIRFLSLTWVILGHTFVFAIYFINNIGYIFPVIMKRWTYAAIYNATFSVDSFFVLSGLLTSYMFLKETNRIGIRSIKLWILYFVHRYWRLTPPYMLVLGFYTAVGIYFSDGPFWAYQPQTFLDHKVCANNWWQNLLYINNFYNATNECMAWSWYLANDMQFHFIVAPLILVCMYFFGLWGAVASVPVVIASIIYTGITAYNDKAATILDMNPNVYFKPWCRVSTYVVGLVTGCLIYEYQKHEIRRISLKIIAIGWLCAAGLCLSTLYGIVGIIDGSYTVSKGVQAFYTATSRFAWSLGLSWVIFACIAGYGGWINSILSWKTFIPLSRLTYCAYLVHPVIMFIFYMSLRISQFVTTIEMVYFFIGHLVIGYMVAFIVSITWESPLLGMERILLKRQ